MIERSHSIKQYVGSSRVPVPQDGQQWFELEHGRELALELRAIHRLAMFCFRQKLLRPYFCRRLPLVHVRRYGREIST
jgi:hypothetical protein